MSHNRLRDLSALASLVHLQHLDASHNDIATDAGLGTLTSCSWLSLSHNASLQLVCWREDTPSLLAALPPDVAATARPLDDVLEEERRQEDDTAGEELALLSVGLH